jgi:isopenicillin N synthase-like dioxygenase
LALELATDDPDYENGDLLLGPNVWPSLTGFRETVYAYYRAVAALAETMCRAFELHLRLAPGYFRQFMQKPTSQLRLLHYLENDAPCDQKDMQMGAHTDYECFTLLHQSKPGLQVLTTENTWQAAPPIQGTYVVNIGDMMEVWTNGAFKATLHRVVNTGNERYSLPYFAAADFNAEIKPVPTMIGAHAPSRYPKIIAGHHLLGQLLRDFAYLNRGHREGRLRLPFDVAGHKGHSLFEQRLSASPGVH